MKITTLTLVFIALTAVKVYACGNGECEPAPEPETPKESYAPRESDSGGAPSSRIYYAICTCDKMKVAWGFESLEFRTAKARSQCELRRTEHLSCPVKWK